MVRLTHWKNRICLTLLLGVAALHSAIADPILSLVATPNPAIVSQTLDLSVNIAGITDAYGYNYSLSFNPSVLQFTGVTEGGFLAAGGSTYFDGGVVDNVAGTISYAFNTLLGAAAGVSGSGNLAHYSFNVIAPGSSAFLLSDVLFLNTASDDIAVTNASLAGVNAVPEPSAYLLFGIGLAGLAVLRRRQRSL